MIPIDGQTMREVAPRFSGELGERQEAIINAVGAVLAATLDRYEINTRLRIAHFLGQTCHESAGFRTTEEFASGQAYEGRKDLGNTQPGDGVRFKGRGLLQLTGRANYQEYGRALGVDLVGQPELAAEPALSLQIACEFWKRKQINRVCDDDDVVGVTRKVNGGKNGLAERSTFTAKAKAAIARIEAFMLEGCAEPGDDNRPVLRRGSKGELVGELQQLLRQQGFALAHDEDFGAATELAVVAFQSGRKLEADGIVGPQTWAALAAQPRAVPAAAKAAARPAARKRA
ncbi:peptidoglycan-binding protein [Ramlibacter alkalitolerans]|uniref:Peptidoglycan-binding protein n=1 Tax=Ramlibacter alkalitolerans TaxID=2039631 RepID=A0ABS1JVV2_9BURK|nr:peptidoglycan-binding protein [Ramlibacter alkalitolerans]MBL0428353.1 peptidoglycan-binding protein [Ramlibacter alkalitolerans]